MISKCENARCDAEYDSLADGKLFDSGSWSTAVLSAARRSTVVWLCSDCAKRFTVEWHNGKAFVVGLSPTSRLRAA
jgi:hypothetical protein